MKKDTLATKVKQQEATFTIRWDGELGQKWMNIDNLKLCLFSSACIGGKAINMVEVAEVEPCILEGCMGQA